MRFLLPLKGSIQRPCYSPNGKELLITHYEQGYSKGAAGLHIVSLTDRNKLKPIHDKWLEGHEISGATWHSTGVVFSTNAFGCSWPYRIDADGKNLVALSRPDKRNFGLCPSLDPSGEQFVFERYRTNDSEVGSIVLGRVGDDDSLTVISGDEDSCHPVWSPDGSCIVWQARGEESGWDWQLRIWGVEEREVFGVRTDLAVSQPSWSRDSRYLVATADDGLYSVAMNGLPGGTIPGSTKLRTPFNPPRIRWLGNGTWSRDGARVLCEASNTSTPSAGQGTWLEIF